MVSAFPAWRPRLMFQRIPLGENCSLGLTVAYQHAGLGAWRGLLVSLFFFTVSIGWTYSAG